MEVQQVETEAQQVETEVQQVAMAGAPILHKVLRRHTPIRAVLRSQVHLQVQALPLALYLVLRVEPT